MIPHQVVFRLYERVNTFTKSGKEWALSTQFIGGGVWTVKTWDEKPSDEYLNDTKELVMWCFEVYHNNLTIPRFNLEPVDITD